MNLSNILVDMKINYFRTCTTTKTKSLDFKANLDSYCCIKYDKE